jgi:tetratricopeptide (TPR) repeat protein
MTAKEFDAWLEAHPDDEAAIPLFREVLATREREYPDERWPLAYPLRGPGTTLMLAGRHEEAEQVLRRTVEVLTEDPGSADRLVYMIGDARIKLAQCLLAQGRFDESEDLVWLVLESVTDRPDLTSVSETARTQLESIARARSQASIR